MRIVYSLLLYCLSPLLIARLWWRGWRAPAYWLRWGERLGQGPTLPVSGCVWIHAVSFGEVQAALPLIKALLARYPATPLLISTMTPTGAQRVRDVFGERVYQCYLPYDFPGAAARFLARTRPRLGVLMETELWPNLLHACQSRAIPVVLVNARLSARSARGYARIGALTRPMLRSLAAIGAQTRADAWRLRALGAVSSRVWVTGNLKFELDMPPEVAEQGRDLRVSWGAARRVWIAASTHEGEETLILQIFAKLRARFPDLLLILVPRHPERFQRVAGLIHRFGYQVQRRSAGGVVAPDCAVYLGDTMGELPVLYAAADLAFVGGSLVPVGGHNPLEPAALGLPCVFGPHTFNFADICRRLRALGAARQARDADELAAALSAYLQDEALRQRSGEAGRRMVAAHRGALARILAMLALYL